jgi:hypothetical protein
MRWEGGAWFMDPDNLGFPCHELTELIIIPFVGGGNFPVSTIPILPVHNIDVIGVLSGAGIFEHVAPHPPKIRATAPRAYAFGHTIISCTSSSVVPKSPNGQSSQHIGQQGARHGGSR